MTVGLEGPRLQRPTNPAPSTAPAPAGARAQEATGPSRFQEVLERVSSQADAGEALVDRALDQRGAVEPRQLLALQAGIYRYGEVVDLASKLADRASQAVRTTLQGGG